MGSDNSRWKQGCDSRLCQINIITDSSSLPISTCLNWVHDVFLTKLPHARPWVESKILWSRSYLGLASTGDGRGWDCREVNPMESAYTGLCALAPIIVVARTPLTWEYSCMGLCITPSRSNLHKLRRNKPLSDLKQGSGYYRNWKIPSTKHIHITVPRWY